VTGFFLVFFFVMQVGSYFFVDQEFKARNYIHTVVKKAFSEAALRFEKAQGIKPFRQSGEISEKDAAGTVILIHGLDEPGLIWMNLAPFLYEQGYKVLIMTYPNDQPIHESSSFFLNQMASYFHGENQIVSIVAHSMGGLVSRDMLTNPLFSYYKKVESGSVPRVASLIMVGTPNHGSEFVRLRIFTEIRDQLHHLFQEETHWLNCILDGAGEAGIELLPGSLFLTRLNSRPPPDNLKMEVIAGSLIPWSRTIGDGLVSVDSAILEGIPLTIVRGSHLTMIRNILTSSRRIPPAVPIVLEMLAHGEVK